MNELSTIQAYMLHVETYNAQYVYQEDDATILFAQYDDALEAAEEVSTQILGATITVVRFDYQLR